MFKITFLAFTLVLIVIAASTIIISEQIAKMRVQEKLSNNIVQGASDLTYLTNDYIIFRGSQQLGQWQTRYASFSSDVSQLSADVPEQQVLINGIRASGQRMKEVFDSIVSSIQTSEDPNMTTQALETSWSCISIQSASLITDSIRLSNLLQAQVDELNLRNFALNFVAIASFSIYHRYISSDFPTYP